MTRASALRQEVRDVDEVVDVVVVGPGVAPIRQRLEVGLLPARGDGANEWEGFLPLGVGPTVVFTVAGMVGAVVVYGLVLRFARRRPVWLFRREALVALVISLVPDVLMLLSGSMPGATDCADL